MAKANGRAVEPLLTIDTREELVYLLGEASEIEHGLLCEYLYAQLSLKRGVGEGVSPEQLARIQHWELTMIDVIKQEMLHLALATNLLTAVGAAPHFERPNFPILSRWYPEGVQIALIPFGERALRHFMYLERPEGMALDDAEGFTALGHVRPVTVDGEPLLGVPEDWATVGHLYRGIEAGLEHLCDRYGESGVFIGPPRAQAVTSIFEWPELLAVTDLRSARTAIEIIVEQGEGARGDWVKSHFGKFVGILEDFLAMQAADPTFDPARPVEPAYVRLPPDVEAGTLIEDRRTARVADLCNAVYEVTLQVLARYYVHHGETAAELDTLAKTAKHLMNWTMRKLIPVLTTLPIGASHPGRTAGPTLEVVRPAFFVLPHREAAWKILKQRLDSLADAAADLARDPQLVALSEIATTLRAFSDDLSRHIEERATVHAG
jgi:Ferritin-like